MSTKCKLVVSLSYPAATAFMSYKSKWKRFLLTFYFGWVILILAIVLHYTSLPDLCLLAAPAGELLPGPLWVRPRLPPSRWRQRAICPLASSQAHEPWAFTALLQLQMLRLLILPTGCSLTCLSKWACIHVHTCPLGTESTPAQNIVRSRINEKIGQIVLVKCRSQSADIPTSSLFTCSCLL